MKYDFKKVVLKDIEGKDIKVPDLYKEVAKVIHALCHKDLDLVEKAREIYQGKEVELDKVEIESIKEVLLGEQSFNDASVKKAIKDYIESVK